MYNNNHSKPAIRRPFSGRALRTFGLFACSLAALATSGLANGQAAGSQAKNVQLRVLSSAPEYVSGGDARIEVRAAPGLHDKINLYLNGRAVDVALHSHGHRLEGVISGLAEGSNLLEVYVKGQSLRDTIELTNYPITGPMFTGPQQMPFVCTTIQSAVSRQPLVDTPTPPGYRVVDGSGNLIGYSRNCSIDTVFTYWYRAASGGNLKPLPADGSRTRQTWAA
jgi:hypothetical protein